jgi:predicted P-loop ATPase/GTPase
LSFKTKKGKKKNVVRTNSEAHSNVLNMFIKHHANTEELKKGKKMLHPTASFNDLPYIRNPIHEILVEACNQVADTQFRYIVQNYKVILLEKGSNSVIYEVEGTLVMY